jgi:hypothetical protein
MSRAKITKQEDGTFLVRLYIDGICSPYSDTVRNTLEEAQKEARNMEERSKRHNTYRKNKHGRRY